MTNNRFWIALVVIAALAATCLFSRRAYGREVAVVIAVASYNDRGLQGLSNDTLVQAESVALTLADRGYAVNQLLGPDATRANIIRLFTKTLPEEMAPGDTLVIFVECLAVGGDFDDPRLLPWDTNPEDLATTGVEVTGLLDQIDPQVKLIVFAKTTHSGALGSVALIGPKPRHWTENSFVLSVAPLGPEAVWSDFGTVVISGLSEAADTSGDHQVSLVEFRRFVEGNIAAATNDRVRVDVAGDYDPAMTIVSFPESVTIPPPPGSPRRHPGIGLSFAGAGLAFGAVSVWSYYRGLEQLEHLTPENSADYQATRAMYFGSIMAGSACVATGLGFLVIRF